MLLTLSEFTKEWFYRESLAHLNLNRDWVKSEKRKMPGFRQETNDSQRIYKGTGDQIYFKEWKNKFDPFIAIQF